MPALEPGELFVVLTWLQLSCSSNGVSITEGVIWLLLATFVELPLVVCLAGSYLH
jgi:hypothetical protein